LKVAKRETNRKRKKEKKRWREFERLKEAWRKEIDRHIERNK
jgi:hypothetical protein